VAKLGKRRGRESNFGERRQALVDQALEPPRRRSFVAGRIGVRQEFVQRECVSKGQPAHFAGGHLRVLDVPAVDRPLQRSVSCALAGHRLGCRWGHGLFGQQPGQPGRNYDPGVRAYALVGLGDSEAIDLFLREEDARAEFLLFTERVSLAEELQL
jgi:hypothetical protein